MIKISIIIPVYNVEQYISLCLDSVIIQDYPNIECIIINDCSTDNTIPLIQDKITAYKGNIQFTILQQDQNRGAAAARNSGIEKSSGDYIYFLDSDDEMCSNCLNTLMQLVTQYPSVDMVQGDVICENDQIINELSIAHKVFPEFTDNQQWITNNFFVSLPVPPWNKLIKSSLLKDHRLFFEEGIVNEDVLWLYKMRIPIKSIAFSRSQTYFHRYNQLSVMNSPENERKRINSYVFILKAFLTNINTETWYMDNFGILKHFQHNKLLAVNDSNKLFFKEEFAGCVHLAIKSDSVPLIFKPMYLILLLPTVAFKKLMFLWNKGLGLLYRVSKY